MENQNNTSTAPAPAQQNGNGQLKPFQEATMEIVMSKVSKMQEQGVIHLPKDYSAPNALRSAWFKLQEIPKGGGQPLVETCTKESIANALLDMVVTGLNPMKHQCSFIPAGRVLRMQREYQGSIALARRLGGLVSVIAVPVWKDDEFIRSVDVETGRTKVVKHEGAMENADGELKGAYAIVTLTSGETFAEVMTMGQIRKAWEMGPMRGNSPAHKNFPDQMAMKTVIGRACKTLINSSDDAGLFDEDDDPRDFIAENVRETIKENANKEAINIDDLQNDGQSLNIEDAEVIEQEEAQNNEEVKTEPNSNQTNGQATITGPGF